MTEAVFHFTISLSFYKKINQKKNTLITFDLISLQIAQNCYRCSSRN